jgi:hypothetical protein
MVVSLYLGAKYALSFVPVRTGSSSPELDNSISQLADTVKRLEKGMGKAGTEVQQHGQVIETHDPENS